MGCALEKIYKLQSISYSAVFCEFNVNKLTAYIRDFPGSPVVVGTPILPMQGHGVKASGWETKTLHAAQCGKIDHKSRVCQNGF